MAAGTRQTLNQSEISPRAFAVSVPMIAICLLVVGCDRLPQKPVLSELSATQLDMADESLAGLVPDASLEELGPLVTFEQQPEYERPTPADAVLRRLLCDPRFKMARSDYGTPERKEVLLHGWPDEEFPALTGYTVERGWHHERHAPNKPMLLGFKLEHLLIPEPDERLYSLRAHVHVTIWNAGGTQNGNTIGGCNAEFRLRKTALGWVAEPGMIFDP